MTAVELAVLVRSGKVTPREVVAVHLRRIRQVDPGIGAFVDVFDDEALAEADKLAARGDLPDLPLAGVPIAIKDNLSVASHSTRSGSLATLTEPSASDHEVVRRLRAAGAVVVGKTTLSELALWPETEGPWGGTRNPWDNERTAGGSSGGSAAAVAAAMVPVAIGNDALGSVRVPAAACGVVGYKPGAGLIPSDVGYNSWYGTFVNGVLATTVPDVAAVLDVLADRVQPKNPGSGKPRAASPDARVRVAVVTKSPFRAATPDDEPLTAVSQAAAVLRDAGLEVRDSEPRNLRRFALPMFARWYAGAWNDSRSCDRALLQARTRRHAQVGRLLLRFGAVRQRDEDRLHRLVGDWFSETDVLLMPVTVAPPPRMENWHQQSWLANYRLSVSWVGDFVGIWNMAGCPAISVPVGYWSCGTPLAVQLVGAPGQDDTLLAIARQLETALPWTRHAPPSTGTPTDSTTTTSR
jgi:amidase